jgi:hypothetical protein
MGCCILWWAFRIDLAYDLTYVHPVCDEIWSIYYIIMIQSSLFIQARDIFKCPELDKVSLVCPRNPVTLASPHPYRCSSNPSQLAPIVLNICLHHAIYLRSYVQCPYFLTLCYFSHRSLRLSVTVDSLILPSTTCLILAQLLQKQVYDRSKPPIITRPMSTA